MRARQTNSGEKGLFPEKKRTFWEGGQALVSVCQNKGFDREKGLFPKRKRMVCGGRCNHRETKVSKLEFRVGETKVSKPDGRSLFISDATPRIELQQKVGRQGKKKQKKKKKKKKRRKRRRRRRKKKKEEEEEKGEEEEEEEEQQQQQ